MDNLYQFETKYLGEDGWCVIGYNKLYPNGVVVGEGFKDETEASQHLYRCSLAQVTKDEENE